MEFTHFLFCWFLYLQVLLLVQIQQIQLFITINGHCTKSKLFKRKFIIAFTVNIVRVFVRKIANIVSHATDAFIILIIIVFGLTTALENLTTNILSL